MRLVIDTNSVIAALIRDGAARSIILSRQHEFFAPAQLLDELDRHQSILLQKSGLHPEALKEIWTILLSKIAIVTSEQLELVVAEATEIMEHIDPHDLLFIAAAIAVPNDGIWSDDAHFQQQKVFRTWTTSELHWLR